MLEAPHPQQKALEINMIHNLFIYTTVAVHKFGNIAFLNVFERSLLYSSSVDLAYLIKTTENIITT